MIRGKGRSAHVVWLQKRSRRRRIKSTLVEGAKAMCFASPWLGMKVTSLQVLAKWSDGQPLVVEISEVLWMTLQKEQDPAGLVACPCSLYLLDIWVCKSFLSFFAYESAVSRTTRCTDRHKIDGWKMKGSTGSLAFDSITIMWREVKLKTVRVVLMIRFFNISLMGSLALSTKPIQSHT